jgi:hypothetical protein
MIWRSMPGFGGSLSMGSIRILAPAQSLYGKVCSSSFSSDYVNFYFFNAYAFLCRVLGMCTMLHGGAPCLRMWQSGRPTVAIRKGSRHGGRGGGFGVLPGRWQGRGGRKLPPSLNPQETAMRRMKMRKRGR